MPNHRSFFIIIFAYFSLMLLLAPTTLLSFDTYYYWDWSRHLALSYYDGSPLIAYCIKLSTLLFGDTLFALSIVGIVMTALTSIILYRTARLFLTKSASQVAMGLWLFAPLVTMDLLQQTTYDNPLTLFWALTLYFSIKFLTDKQRNTLYYLGVSAGLLLLSKYTGVVLLLGLMIFLITSNHRNLFKSLHFYIAILISCAFFSPVIWWNYQHEWQSFIYQLTSHQVGDAIHPLHRAINALFKTFLPSLNLMLIPPLLCWIYQDRSKSSQANDIIQLCQIISMTVLCFYLFAASKTEVRAYWLAPYLVTSALLGGYCYQILIGRKFTHLLIGVYALSSIAILVNNSLLFNFTTPKKLIDYHLIQQLNATYPKLPQTVFTSGWFEARSLFFLKNKPEIHTIGCGTAENQYALWRSNAPITEMLYIDHYDRSDCLKKYFEHCEQKILSYDHHNHKTNKIYIYQCFFSPIRIESSQNS